MKEPSTWAGLGVLLQVAKPFVMPQYAPVIDAVTMAAGGVAVGVPDPASVN